MIRPGSIQEDGISHRASVFARKGLRTAAHKTNWRVFRVIIVLSSNLQNASGLDRVLLTIDDYVPDAVERRDVKCDLCFDRHLSNAATASAMVSRRVTDRYM